ncbi:MAG: Methylmalonyl-CoA mutase, partial [uncultured Microvirga sp.]
MTAAGDAAPDAVSFTAAFPPATREAWVALAERALKGASVETLVSRSHDGLRIEPLYPKASPDPQPTRAHGPWRVAQRVDHPDPGEANALALADLNGGANSLTLVLAGAPAARGFGLRIETIDDLERALSGIRLDWIHLRLEAGGQGRQAAATLLALARRRGHDLAALDLDLGLDPIGAMAATG